MGRIMRGIVRVRAWFKEYQPFRESMENPEMYEEMKRTAVSYENLRKLPRSVHAEVWSSCWKSYTNSFGDSFAFSKRKRDAEVQQKADEKIFAVQDMVKDLRKATHNTPEDIQESKKAVKELMQELNESQDEIKSLAQEKMDILRLSLTEFSSGYRQARDEEMERVKNLNKSSVQSFMEERWQDVSRAKSVVSEALAASAAAETEQSERDSSRGAESSKPKGATAGSIGKAGSADSAGSEVASDAQDELASFKARDLLSKRAREALDEMLNDPDVKGFIGRADEVKRERLAQAEAAARVLQGEKAGASGVGGREDNPSQDSSTPIVSGLASDAKGFVADRLGQAADGAREVVDAALEVGKSHRGRAQATKDVERPKDVERSPIEGDTAGGGERANVDRKGAKSVARPEGAANGSAEAGEKSRGRS